MKLDLNISQVPDTVVRDNFQRLLEASRNNPLTATEWKLVEGEITGNNSGAKFRHNLKYIPKDAILTSAIWSGTIGVLTLRTERFDDTNVEVTVSGLSGSETVTFRALVGRIET
jgi:hypothetical protein